MNRYWNNEGKYQAKSDELGKLMPSWGRTDNKYLNLYTVASQLYYDIYNNGGWNIKDSYVDDIEKYIVPLAENIKTINFKTTFNNIYYNGLKKEDKLERLMDEIIEFLEDKDLSYTKYVVYVNSDTRELSHEEKEGFWEMSFGEKDQFEAWVNHRIEAWSYKYV